MDWMKNGRGEGGRGLKLSWDGQLIRAQVQSRQLSSRSSRPQKAALPAKAGPECHRDGAGCKSG